MIRLFFMYIFLQIVLYVAFCKSNIYFCKNIQKWNIITIGGSLIALLFQAATAVFVHSDLTKLPFSKYDPGDISVAFSKILEWSVIVSILIFVVGIGIFIFRSWTGYLLCPLALNVAFFGSSVQKAASGQYLSIQEFRFQTDIFLVVYALAALIVISLIFIKKQRNNNKPPLVSSEICKIYK